MVVGRVVGVVGRDAGLDGGLTLYPVCTLYVCIWTNGGIRRNGLADYLRGYGGFWVSGHHVLTEG